MFMCHKPSALMAARSMRTLPSHEYYLVLMLVFTATFRPTAALAQNPDTAASPYLVQNLQDGVDALSRGEVEIADDILNSLIQIDPGYYSPEHGSAAFWWGKALARNGDGESAHRAWSAGIGALERISVFDARLVDTYITSVFEGERRQEFPRALQLYLRLIAQADEGVSRADHCIVVKRIAQVLPLLSRAEQRRISDADKRTRCDNFSTKPGAATFLRSWWASQDPYLYSAQNERLQEHLDRTVLAESHYPAGDRVMEFDERGEIYVRFGPPSRVVALGEFENRFPQSQTTLGQPTNDLPPATQESEATDHLTSGEAFVVPAAGLPTGQLWLYDHINSSGYYFFIKEGRHYRLGEVSDLVPLQHRNFSGFRGQQNANLTAAILFGRQGRHGAYAHLAPIHPDFASRYTAYETYSNSGRLVPPMHRIWAELRADEQLSSAARENQMPTHFSAHAREHCPLPIYYQLARFLNGNRDTVIHLYWQRVGLSSLKENLRACTSAPFQSAPEQEYMLRLTSIQTAYDSEARDMQCGDTSFQTHLSYPKAQYLRIRFLLCLINFDLDSSGMPLSSHEDLWMNIFNLRIAFLLR